MLYHNRDRLFLFRSLVSMQRFFNGKIQNYISNKGRVNGRHTVPTLWSILVSNFIFRTSLSDKNVIPS